MLKIGSLMKKIDKIGISFGPSISLVKIVTKILEKISQKNNQKARGKSFFFKGNKKQKLVDP